MLHRRLLLAGGGAATLLPPSTFDLTAIGEGGYNQQSDYKAVHYNGRTYFGWINTDGDVKIATYVNATGEVEDEFTLHAALELQELHPSPSILVRDSDHRIMVFYTRHNGAQLYMRISTNPEDTSAWGAEQNIDSQVGGSQYTYPTVFETLWNGDNTTFVWYRDRPGGGSDTALSYTFSIDNGTTWDPNTAVMDETAQFYWKLYGADERIDVVCTNGHPTTNAPTKLYHMWNDSNDWMESDGTDITSFPIPFADMTEIYDGSEGSAWVLGLTRNADDYPVVLYKTGTYGAGDWDLWRARWTGSAWDTQFVVNGGGPTDVVYAPGDAVLDQSDPDIVYAALYIDGQWEMNKLTTDDDGVTWNRQQLTSNSTLTNLWPATVFNRAELKALWLYGTVTGTEPGLAEFDLAIRGTLR